MHPEIREQNPGLCPECGMNLLPAEALAKEGVPASEKPKKGAEKRACCGEMESIDDLRSRETSHETRKEMKMPRSNENLSSSAKASADKHAGHSKNIFKTKFWVSLILSIPVVLYSDIAQKLAGYTTPEFPGSKYLSFVLASIVFFYGGSIFITSAYREIRAKLPGMMTLIALAVSTAYIYSAAVTFMGGGDVLFWELSTLITIMLLGHWIEMRAVSGAQSALKELSKLLPDQAEVIEGGSTRIIPLSELKKGDIALVKPGGRIPADGIVKEGASDVNESIVTGESKPVGKKVGDAVIAGTTNGDGSLKITVAKIGAETFLAGVMRLVAEAQASKSHLQILSDRAALYLTIVAVVTGAITFAAWLAVSGIAPAISRMVAVLVIACPHALGLAIPLVASISTTKAARNGFLVKQRLALEAARSIDIVLFDKTGTLTKGEFGIDAIIPETGATEEEVLQFAASANSHSEHTLAKAMVDEAKNRNIKLLDIKNFQRIPGKGVSAEISGEKILVGSVALSEEKKTTLSAETKTRIAELASEGKTINVVMKGDKALGAIALSDVIRDESREAIKTLREMGVKTAMVTGDADDVAKWVAKELGIDEYFAKVLPERKSEKVAALQSSGYKVAMVGDGVNDAPALAKADLGIAIGAGTNIAIESAGIILVRNDPRDIPKIVKLSKLTYAKMLQNLFWAAGYNIIAIPLAAGALVKFGIVLEPAFAALLMSLSTVIVAINAVLLRRKTL